MTPAPTLVVVSGPPGAGKTMLAHRIARAVGCPAICRDEIKEGMVQATPGFVAGPADELTRRTLPVFFGVLDLLLRAGVTTVAEAAFQDRLWRPGLEPLRSLARIRIVHCSVGADVAFRRALRRGREDPLRRAHENPGRPVPRSTLRAMTLSTGLPSMLPGSTWTPPTATGQDWRRSWPSSMTGAQLELSRCPDRCTLGSDRCSVRSGWPSAAAAGSTARQGRGNEAGLCHSRSPSTAGCTR